MSGAARAAGPGRRWHMNDLFAIELFLSVLIILVALTIAISDYWNGVRRAQASAAWHELRSIQLLWIEERAISGTAASDAIAYQRVRAGTAEQSVAEGSALGSIRGLEALRLRAARSDGAEPKADGDKAGRVSVGISDGVPVAVMNRSFTSGPVMIELRPTQLDEQSPVVAWLCGSVAPPRGWAAPAAREPQIPDLYLPYPCRERMAR